MAAEDAADGLRVLVLDVRDVEAELEARPAPRHPDDPVAEDLLGQRLSVGGGRDRDAGVGVQVVDVRGVDEAVHRRVDRRRGATLAEQAVVERRDHLVLPLDAGIDIDQRADAVEPQHRQAGLGEGAEVATGPLHPQQLDRLAGDRIGCGALGRGVAARVVGVPRVGAQPVGPANEIKHRLLGRSRIAAVSHQGFSSGLRPAHAVRLDRLLIPAGEVGPHRVAGRFRCSRHVARSRRTSV